MCLFLTQSNSDFAQMVRSVAQIVYAESGSQKVHLLRVEEALVGHRSTVIDLYIDGIGNLSFIQVTQGYHIDDWVEGLLTSVFAKYLCTEASPKLMCFNRMLLLILMLSSSITL